MSWLGMFERVCMSSGLIEDMRQEVAVALLEAQVKGLQGKQAGNYVSRMLHRMLRDYGFRKIGGKYMRMEVPMSSLTNYGGESGDY